MDSTKIRLAEPGDRARVASLQAMAFGRDPVMRWLFPEAHEYLTHFPGFVAAFAGDAITHSTAWIAGEFGGAAMWLPPGEHIDPEPIGAIFEKVLRESIRADVFAVFEQVAECHIEERHWYLPMIGVDPGLQGQGLGSALLAHSLALCDQDSLPAYLESSNPSNVPLYERHGFRVVKTIQVGNSPELIPMLREAR